MDDNLLEFLKIAISALGPIGVLVFVFCLIAYFLTKSSPKYSGREQAKLHRYILGVAVAMLVLGVAAIVIRMTGLLDVPFSVSGKVDCPGGGGSNARSDTVSYTAPSGAEIVNYSVEQGSSNDGNTGTPVAQPDENGRLRTVSVRFSCDPPGRIGAGGGWNNITLVGNYRYGIFP